MPSPKIRSQYDTLTVISRSFSHEAERTRQSLSKLLNRTRTLQEGDWVGKGATVFYAEMHGSVAPALRRLGQALERAAHVTNEINAIMHQAETEASRVFHLTDNAAPVGDALDGGTPGEGLPTTRGPMGGGGDTPQTIPTGTTVTVNNDAANGLNLRKTADIPGDPDANVIEFVPNGTALEVVNGEPVEADGHYWIQVRTPDGQVGWIAMEKLTTGAGGSEASAAEGSATDALPPDVLDPDVIPTGLMVTTHGGPDGVNLRSDPEIPSGDSDKNVLDQLPNGTEMEVVDGRRVHANGHDWIQVRAPDGTVGWMAVDLLQVPMLGSPLPDGHVSSGYGNYRDNEYDDGEHPGVDLVSDTGDVTANANGTIYFFQANKDANGNWSYNLYDPNNAVANSNLDGFGNFAVLVTEIDGVTYYQVLGHMDSFSGDLHSGDTITAGTYIGEMGNTGTGEKHLHWEVRTDAGFDFVYDDKGNVTAADFQGQFFPDDLDTDPNYVDPLRFGRLLYQQEQAEAARADTPQLEYF